MTHTVFSPCAFGDLRQELPRVALSPLVPTRSSITLGQLGIVQPGDALPYPPVNPPDLANLLALDSYRAAEVLAACSMLELADQAVAQVAWMAHYGLQASPLELLAEWIDVVLQWKQRLDRHP